MTQAPGDHLETQHPPVPATLQQAPSNAEGQLPLKPVVAPSTPGGVLRGVDRFLSVQRPVVLAHIRAIRAARPAATPEEVVRILENRYLAAVTAGGAAVGATAVIPAVGVGTSLALSAVETAGFLEASALFAQSVTEVHGIAVDDPERARALVMTLVTGSAGVDLVKQVAGQAVGTAPARGQFWGEMVTKSLPSGAVRGIVGRLQTMFLKRFGAAAGGTAIGRAIPFGIGAVVGGAGNLVLGRRIVQGAREAFGPAPAQFPDVLAPRAGAGTATRLGAVVASSAVDARDRVADAAVSTRGRVADAARSVRGRLRRGRPPLPPVE